MRAHLLLSWASGLLFGGEVSTNADGVRPGRAVSAVAMLDNATSNTDCASHLEQQEQLQQEPPAHRPALGERQPEVWWCHHERVGAAALRAERFVIRCLNRRIVTPNYA